MLNTNSTAQKATTIESWNCVVLLLRIIAAPTADVMDFEPGRACSVAPGGSALGDTNQHFLTAVQRNLLTSMESRGS
jgi:hypothetical protein